MNAKKSARFLNPVLRSPWESRASKLYLSTKKVKDPKNFVKTSSNSSIIKKIEVIPKQPKTDKAQKHTIINIIDSTSTSPSSKSEKLQNGPIQWLKTQNQNVNQSSSVNIQNVMPLQDMKVTNSPTPTPAKDKQLIKLYTQGNFQCSSAPNCQTNSSAENVLNDNSSISSFNNYMLISSPVDQYNFSQTPAVISPINNQSYDVNQQWNSYGTFTIETNTASTFSSAPNTVVNSSNNIQSNEFDISGKENELILNSINIPALQPLTYYSKTSNTSIPLGQDDIRNATSSVGGFQQDEDIRYKVQLIDEASRKHLPQFPNTSVAAVKVNEARAQNECENSISMISLHEITKKTPNQERTVIAPSNKQKILLWGSNQASEMITNDFAESHHLVQEEQSNSTNALGIFEELTETQHNKKRKLNVTDPEHKIATNSEPTLTTPVVNDEFISCLCEEFDINDKGDIEFPSRNRKTPIIDANAPFETCQNVLGFNEISQISHESQINREGKEKTNKVGVVLKKKKEGYQSFLL